MVTRAGYAGARVTTHHIAEPAGAEKLCKTVMRGVAIGVVYRLAPKNAPIARVASIGTCNSGRHRR